jgi:hypothetical protein
MVEGRGREGGRGSGREGGRYFQEGDNMSLKFFKVFHATEETIILPIIIF